MHRPPDLHSTGRVKHEKIHKSRQCLLRSIRLINKPRARIVAMVRDAVRPDRTRVWQGCDSYHNTNTSALFTFSLSSVFVLSTPRIPYAVQDDVLPPPPPPRTTPAVVLGHGSISGKSTPRLSQQHLPFTTHGGKLPFVCAQVVRQLCVRVCLLCNLFLQRFGGTLVSLVDSRRWCHCRCWSQGLDWPQLRRQVLIADIAWRCRTWLFIVTCDRHLLQ